MTSPMADATREELIVLPDGPQDRAAEFKAYFTEARRSDLARAAWFLTGDTHRAEELLQQALVKTYMAWPRARATDPTAYARRVMANARIDAWRLRRREIVTAPEWLAGSPGPDSLAGVDDRDAINRALQGLGARQRRVVVLRYVVGLTEKEVAEDLGISIGTVKSQASRGLTRLRTLMMGTTKTGERL